MCHTQTPEEMPLTTANGSMGAPSTPSLDENGMPVGAQPSGAGGADALSQSVSAGNPSSVSVQTPTKFGRAMELLTGGAFDPAGGADAPGAGPGGKTTKFGMLMQVLKPALEGGLIGLAGGKGHPQGGFGAANDFYARQRAFNMQQTMLQRQLYNDQFKNLLDYARTQHEMSIPPLTRVPGAIKGKDANGNDIYMSLNPQTMRYEPIQGITPESNPDYTQVGTDKGIVLYDKHGSAPTRPLTIPTGAPQSAAATGEPGPDGNAATSIPSTPPSRFNSGSPRVPGKGSANQSPTGIVAMGGNLPRTAPAGAVTEPGAPNSPLPLQPPNRHVETLEEKAAAAIKAKHPDWTDDQILASLKAETRKPNEADSPTMTPKEYRTRFQSLSTQLNNNFSQIEKDRKQKLAALGKQYAGIENAPQEEVQQIEADTADAKQAMHQRLVDSAKAQGIDLGAVPDYRSQIAGGEPAATKPAAASASTPKVGDTRSYHGIPFKFDGKQWVRSKSKV